MEERELQTKGDAKPIPERQDEGTGMGVIWDIQRFDRLLEEAKAKRLAVEEKAKLQSESKLQKPTQCIFWNQPELILQRDMMKNGFDWINTYEDDSHWSRYLLKCRECGQLYFYEFYEWTDWTGGNDPQYSTYIPVETDAQVEELRKTSPVELLQFVPRLQKDFPGEATEPRASWVGK